MASNPVSRSKNIERVSRIRLTLFLTIQIANHQLIYLPMVSFCHVVSQWSLDSSEV